MIMPRILIIDDQYARDADERRLGDEGGELLLQAEVHGVALGQLGP